MTHHTETTKTDKNEAIEFRVRRTTVDGQRGWVFETEHNGEWSEPTGPFSCKEEAKIEARNIIASW